jgi:hypothetical protein
MSGKKLKLFSLVSSDVGELFLKNNIGELHVISLKREKKYKGEARVRSQYKGETGAYSQTHSTR